MKKFIALLIAALLVMPAGVLAAESDWISEEPALEPYAYSFAVVGDTQIVNRDYPQHFAGIYDWILDNAEEKNTKMVIGLGDITDDNTEKEWVLADAVFQRVSGVLPLSIVRGNHDGPVADSSFDRYLSFEKYGNLVSGSMENSIRNAYIKFDVGNIKYLILNIDINGDDDSIYEWANEVCAANPDRNIIVTTHGYMNADGTLIQYYARIENGYYWSEDGQGLWDNVVSQHENIVMVLCGHVYTNDIVVTENTGVNGNVVKQVIVNPQTVDLETEGGAGLVAMFYFSEDGKTVQVRYYSTIQKKYYKAGNQIAFNIETVSNGTHNTATIENAEASFNATEDAVGTLNLTDGSCTFNASADVIKNGSLSLSVATGSGITGGKLVAGCYDSAGRLLNIKVYDSAEVVPMAFDNVKPGTTVKVRWWEGTNTIMPIGNGSRKGA